MEQKYTDYRDVDQQQLQHDIDAIKKTIGTPNEEDFKHLLKLELWGRLSNFTGFALILLITYLSYAQYSISSLVFWSVGFVAAFLIGVANVSRWSNVTHPILHGAYDKVPNIPKRYTKDGFAAGKRRWIDWMDWIKPDAWSFEHNIMHHYHLGEADDPDNVEKNLVWLHEAKMPNWVKYTVVYLFAFTWKFTYYAPNTLRILENKARRKRGEADTLDYETSLFNKNGRALWFEYILPYGILKFVAIPFLFFPLGGLEAVANVAIIMAFSEIFANLHSFLVIVPNHSAEDIYQFSTPHKTQGEYYLRQIMGSVNYNTGSDLIDFGHGFLNYQIEHHLFPNMPLSFYQKMQPIVKEICKKHNLEYRQESVFKRILMTVDLMVGKTKLLTIEGI
ncbi:fatty acid desaturase [Sulfurimonas sp. SAG-AH-194-I05]|nr:fatty acid desaturase [Sulfurimonas sp. SAG-AH-194-I05]MDF1874755.1 fatty acid desaturase [Sulfurimonas sp. SAG-AH-194-I05]